MSTYNLIGNSLPLTPQGGKTLPQGQGNSTSSNLLKTNGANVASEVHRTINKKVYEPAQPESTKVEKGEIKDQIEELQQFNQSIDRSLQFKVDDELGVTIVRVVDKETDELIRQFPPEELINLSRRLKELNNQDSANSGVLLEERA